jgi:hypothetical protein
MKSMKKESAKQERKNLLMDMPVDKRASMLAYKGTPITKENVKAAMRDDAAHMDYLKRDINYDAKHGASDKRMTDDEKHISKLAGDLKADKKKEMKFAHPIFKHYRK